MRKRADNVYVKIAVPAAVWRTLEDWSGELGVTPNALASMIVVRRVRSGVDSGLTIEEARS